MYSTGKQNDSLALPYCNPCVFVNAKGVVTNAMGKEMQQIAQANGELGCILRWFDGEKWYPLSLLKMATFKTLKLSVHYWRKLSVQYKDGDVTNTALDNLVWKYPTKLEVKNFPGYYYIPCFSRYVISEKGVVIDTGNGMPVRLTSSKGYICCCLRNDWAKWCNCSLHRLLCYVFQDYPANFDAMHVNHKNGIKNDNRLENLEIVTALENCLHAIATGLNTGVKRVQAIHDKSGESVNFNTLTECCVHFQINRSALSGKHAGWRFVLTDCETRPKLDYMRKIISRNVLTGEQVTYNSIRECSRRLGFTVLAINNYLKTAQDTVLGGFYQLRLDKDQLAWTTWNVGEKPEHYNALRKAVEVRDVRTGTVTKFSSFKECSQALSVSEDTIGWRVSRADQPVFSDGLQYRYALSDAPWRQVNDPEREITDSMPVNAVLVRHLETGRVSKFDSQAIAAHALGVCDATVHKWLHQLPSMMTLPGLVQVKLATDPTPWREVLSPEEELAGNDGSRKRAEVKDLRNGEVKVFASLKECADFFNCGITTIAYRVSTNGQRIIKKNHLFRYYGETKPWLQ